jgi:soluble lytic murein transglycosylase
VKRRRQLILLLVSILVIGAALSVWRERAREKKFIPQIQTAAVRYGVDPMLVKAIVWRESRFTPDVRGRSGEIGLMQIQEIAAQEWADAEHIARFDHEHCLDPGTNTLAGTFYFAKLLKRYSHTDNPIPYALADYNAGRANVLKWNSGTASTNSAVFIGQIRFPGTERYIKTVMRRYALYQFLLKLGWS